MLISAGCRKSVFDPVHGVGFERDHVKAARAFVCRPLTCAQQPLPERREHAVSRSYHAPLLGWGHTGCGAPERVPRAGANFDEHQDSAIHCDEIDFAAARMDVARQ